MEDGRTSRAIDKKQALERLAIGMIRVLVTEELPTPRQREALWVDLERARADIRIKPHG